MTKILNLTQHPASAEQRAAGVVDLTGDKLVELKGLLTFNNLPWAEQVEEAACLIADLATDSGFESAMIGGAPFLMPSLTEILCDKDVQVLFAFSRRESVEEVQADGSVLKRAVFRHLGFVEG